MANENMEFRLKFKADTKDLTKTADQLEDAGDAAKTMADMMRTSAGAIESELEQTAKIAERLGEALGPEMRAKIGQNGLNDVASTFRQAGLTIEDVDRNIDDLTDGIRRMDAAADKAGGSTLRIGDNAVRARSAMANFAGNAAQELPGVASALGPLNTGVSQLVEGLAEGDIKFGQLLTAGLAMAGASLILNELTDDTEDLAEKAEKAFKKKLVDDWAAALRSAKPDAEDLMGVFSDTEKITSAMRVFGHVVEGDVVPALADAGLKAEDWIVAVTGGAEGAAEFQAKLEAAGLTTIQVATLMNNLTTSQELYGDSAELAEQRAKVFGDAVEETGEQAETAESKIASAASEVRGLGVDARTASGRVSSLDKELAKLDQEDAIADLSDQFDNMNEAALKAWTATNEGAANAADLQDDYKQSVRDTKRAVIEYGLSLDGLPQDAITKVLADIDEGSIKSAEAAIAALTQARTISLFVKAVGGSGGTGKAPGAGSGSGSGSKGTPSDPTPNGPEAFNAARTGGVVVNLHANTYGQNPEEFSRLIADAVARHRNDGGTI